MTFAGDCICVQRDIGRVGMIIVRVWGRIDREFDVVCWSRGFELYTRSIIRYIVFRIYQKTYKSILYTNP